MKPQKELCKKCVSLQTKNGWTQYDETAWTRGKIFYCPVLKATAKVRNNLPQNCAYHLETLLIEDKNAK